MKKTFCLVLIFVISNCGLHAQSIRDAVCDYLSKSLFAPSSLTIDTITPIDTLTVGESLKIRIDDTDSSCNRIYVSISFADTVSAEECARIVDEEEKKKNNEMKQEHLELLKLQDFLADKLDNIISVTYEISFCANDVNGNPVNYDRVFRVNSEGRITEMAENVGSLRARIDIIEYNRLQNKLYNEICRWDNYD